MIDFNAEIKPNHSLANIILKDNISTYIEDLCNHHVVEIRDYPLPNNEVRTAYVVDKTLTITTLADGTILSLGGNINYKGAYRNILTTGMKFGDIAKLTKKQRIFNGSVIIDDDFGFSYVLPSPYDEIADSVQHIPSELVLEEIYVADFSSWKN